MNPSLPDAAACVSANSFSIVFQLRMVMSGSRFCSFCASLDVRMLWLSKRYTSRPTIANASLPASSAASEASKASSGSCGSRQTNRLSPSAFAVCARAISSGENGQFCRICASAAAEAVRPPLAALCRDLTILNLAAANRKNNCEPAAEQHCPALCRHAYDGRAPEHGGRLRRPHPFENSGV